MFLFVFLGSIRVFSQEKHIEHIVSKGETISEIAKYYNVKPSEIYGLNPEARNGIKYKGILLIPSKEKNSDAVFVSDYEIIRYEVKSKETLYGIAKQNKISVEDLYKNNPELEKEGLKTGQMIYVPQKKSGNTSTAKTEKVVEVETSTVVRKSQEERTVHEVLPKESLYSIAKLYGITLADLQKTNSELENRTLKVGQKIVVPVKRDVNSGIVGIVEKETNADSKIVDFSKSVEKEHQKNEITHEVLPKETKYGIARQYGLTVAELENQNPGIEKNLLIGSVLKIRSLKEVEIKTSVESVVVKEEEPVGKKFYDVDFVEQLIATASENIGTRYRSGGTTKDGGFDCSGLVYATFGMYDIKLPRSIVGFFESN